LERKLTAILCADVYGYSRLMGEDEEGTLRTLSACRKITDSLIERHHGRFVNSAGDSVLAEFASVVEAVTCAVSIQTALRAENAELPLERRMQFRIGVNLGDVMVEGEQIYGDGVNVAARLESLADPGGICISGTVHEQVRDKLTLAYEDRGEQAVKNIVRPVRVWRVLLDEAAPAKIRRSTRWYWRGGVLSLAGVVVIVGTIILVQHVSLKPPHTHASIPPPPSPALALPDKPSIAVLPFTNMSGDREQEYFSDGITDDVITDLSRLPGLFVIARNSTFTYKGKAAKLQDVGKDLGVKYVLEGGVRKAGDQVRITVQLADTTTDTELWAERYDRPLRDVFALQDEIVQKIVRTLNLEVNLAQKGAVVPRSTENLEAYDDLLRGTAHELNFSKTENLKARRMFEKAIDLDPKYATAYSALGFNYWLSWVLTYNPESKQSVERALNLEQQAIALDDSLANAHSILALIYVEDGQYDQAITEAERGVALDPNSASGHLWLAQVLNELNRPTEALAALEEAMRLDPRHPNNYLGQQGWAYTQLGRWEEAISLLKRDVAVYPDNLWSHLWMAEAYIGLGDEHAARVEASKVERAVSLAPDSANGYVVLAQVMAATGRPAEALRAAENAIRLDPSRGVFCSFMQGWAYSQLGQWDKAIALIKGNPFSNDPWPHVWLAVDYIELGHDEAARAEIAEVLRLDPQFSLKLGLAAFPVMQQRAAADLRKAGLN